jgi:hypothetical protein
VRPPLAAYTAPSAAGAGEAMPCRSLANCYFFPLLPRPEEGGGTDTLASVSLHTTGGSQQQRLYRTARPKHGGARGVPTGLPGKLQVVHTSLPRRQKCTHPAMSYMYNL